MQEKIYEILTGITQDNSLEEQETARQNAGIGLLNRVPLGSANAPMIWDGDELTAGPAIYPVENHPADESISSLDDLQVNTVHVIESPDTSLFPEGTARLQVVVTGSGTGSEWRSATAIGNDIWHTVRPDGSTQWNRWARTVSAERYSQGGSSNSAWGEGFAVEGIERLRAGTDTNPGQIVLTAIGNSGAADRSVTLEPPSVSVEPSKSGYPLPLDSDIKLTLPDTSGTLATVSDITDEVNDRAGSLQAALARIGTTYAALPIQRMLTDNDYSYMLSDADGLSKMGLLVRYANVGGLRSLLIYLQNLQYPTGTTVQVSHSVTRQKGVNSTNTELYLCGSDTLSFETTAQGVDLNLGLCTPMSDGDGAALYSGGNIEYDAMVKIGTGRPVHITVSATFYRDSHNMILNSVTMEEF